MLLLMLQRDSEAHGESWVIGRKNSIWNDHLAKWNVDGILDHGTSVSKSGTLLPNRNGRTGDYNPLLAA